MVHNLSAPHKHGISKLKEIYALVTLDSMECSQRVVYCYEVSTYLQDKALWEGAPTEE